MSNEQFQDKAGVVIFPPLLYFGTLLPGIILSYIFPFYTFAKEAAYIGWVGLLTGLLVLRLSTSLLNRVKTTIHPGGSTTSIVKTGIFKLTRNPIYLSFTLIYMGISTLLDAPISLLLLIPLLWVVEKGIIEREEKYLLKKFGAQYQTYKSSVRRWL